MQKAKNYRRKGMKLLKVIVDEKPKIVTDCQFLKVGLFKHKCKLLNKNIH